MHGLGNDFVIIDRRNHGIEIDTNIIKKLSDRRTGAGCDQLITIEKALSADHDVFINFFNPTGDKVEACGNGTRCVARFLFEEFNSDNLNLKSMAGILKANKISETLVSVNLGKFSHQWNEIPLSKEMDTLNIPIKIENLSNGVAVNIGNPHIVFFINNINICKLDKLGPKLENHEFFPNKTNVEIIEIINHKTIKMKVWERGAGITPACGSGACAAVYASMLKKYTGDNVEVQVERGTMQIKIINNEAILIGPTEESYRGYIEV